MTNVTPISPQMLSRIMKDKRASERVVANDDWAERLRERHRTERVDRIIEDVRRKVARREAPPLFAIIASSAFAGSLATAVVLYFVAEWVLR